MSYNTVSHPFADGNAETVAFLSAVPDIHDQQAGRFGRGSTVYLLVLRIFLIDGNLFIEILYRNEKDRIYAVRILTKVQADNLALPLALLLARTFLPPALLILALKP